MCHFSDSRGGGCEIDRAGLWLRTMQLLENQSRLLAPGALIGIRPGGGLDAGEAHVVWHRSQVRLPFQMPHRTVGSKLERVRGLLVTLACRMAAGRVGKCPLQHQASLTLLACSQRKHEDVPARTQRIALSLSQRCCFRPLLKHVSLKSPFSDWKQQNLLADVTFSPVCPFDAIKIHQQNGEHHQARRLR